MYTAKRDTGVAASYIEARLAQPSLVRDTSKFSAFKIVKHSLQTAVINKMKFLVLHVRCHAHEGHRDGPHGGYGEDNGDLISVDEVISFSLVSQVYTSRNWHLEP